MTCQLTDCGVSIDGDVAIVTQVTCARALVRLFRIVACAVSLVLAESDTERKSQHFCGESRTVVKVYEYVNRVRVVFHKNDQYTRVDITDELGERLPFPPLEIRTGVIPFELRQIGSRFLLKWRSIWPEESDTIDLIREHLANMSEVLRLNEE